MRLNHVASFMSKRGSPRHRRPSSKFVQHRTYRLSGSDSWGGRGIIPNELKDAAAELKRDAEKEVQKRFKKAALTTWQRTMPNKSTQLTSGRHENSDCLRDKINLGACAYGLLFSPSRIPGMSLLECTRTWLVLVRTIFRSSRHLPKAAAVRRPITSATLSTSMAAASSACSESDIFSDTRGAHNSDGFSFTLHPR